MTIEAAVLVSIGGHPLSNRAQRAQSDARAVELALNLPAGQVHLLHAGNSQNPALRDYLGMGIGELTVLKQPEEADITAAVTDFLRDLRPDIILAGQRSERGEGSGMLPYLIAEALGYPLLANIVSAAINDRQITAQQALPRGQRRSIGASLPVVITVDQAAPPARQSAYGPAQRGKIVARDSPSDIDEERTRWIIKAARKKPKRLKITPGGSAVERLQAATQIQATGQILDDLDAEQAAQIIFDRLQEHGVLKRS